MERVDHCIALLKELTVQILPDEGIDGSRGCHLDDALHLTLSRSFLIAYAVQREAGLDHEAALRRLNKVPTEK
jgi:predicted ATP-grasp superfamily ATP-dependent carboligase